MAVQEAGDPGWGMRASDKDREAVVAVLRDAYTVGRLTLAVSRIAGWRDGGKDRR
jgi:Domain of unknown function (DUF1707)